jgi:hypothetical protein
MEYDVSLRNVMNSMDVSVFSFIITMDLNAVSSREIDSYMSNGYECFIIF